VSLLPEETLAELDARFGRRFRELPDTARLALAAVAIENSVTHARLKEMSTDHPKDLSKTLASLVEGGFLVSRGATRGTVYFFPDKTPDATADGLVSGVAPAHEAEKGLEQMPGGLEHSTGSLEHLRPLAAEAQKSKKVSQAAMQQMLVQLCSRTPLTAQQLAGLLNRDIHSLKNHYLKPMVKSGVLKLLIPDKPNHPNQAYTAGQPLKPT
jgi:predicted HTH transcriptional regulator